jgi:hypothetical protein
MSLPRGSEIDGQQERDNKNENDSEHIARIRTGPIVLFAVNCGSGSFVFVPGRGKDGVDPRGQASGIIPRFETRLNFILGDLFANGIRQDAFQPVSHLDKHLSVLSENEHHHAVVLVLLPNFP